jgi:hypothetical protein
MRVRWIGVASVLAVVLAIIAYKQQRVVGDQTEGGGRPAVLLVADLSEADEPSDRCAEIIRAVEAAGARGVRNKQLTPDSSSPLLKEYHVVSAPTVILIDNDGREMARFVGESEDTVRSVEEKLAMLSKE